MSERAAPQNIWSGIDILKITAGTLAAVAAAFLGSFLGVAGTLIGAAVASLVGSIGTEVFQKSLGRAYDTLRGVRPDEVAATPLAAAATPADGPIPVHGEAATHAVPVTGAPHLPEAPQRTRLMWKRVLVAAGAFFVLAMGGIFAVEAVAGEPLATMVGSSDAKGTSISPKQDPTPMPSGTPSESASPDASTDSTTEEPTGGPSVIPTIPPSAEPSPQGTTTQAPAPTGGETTGGGSNGSEGDGANGSGSNGSGSNGSGSNGAGSNGAGSADRGTTDLVPDGDAWTR